MPIPLLDFGSVRRFGFPVGVGSGRRTAIRDRNLTEDSSGKESSGWRIGCLTCGHTGFFPMMDCKLTIDAGTIGAYGPDTFGQ